MHRLPLLAAAGLVAVLALVLPAPASAAAPTAAASQAATPAPEPRESVRTFARRLERALTTRNCPGLATINRTSQFRLPCPSRSNRRIRAAFRGFDVRGTGQYGTGGAIDFTDGEAPRGGTYVLALGQNRRWSIILAPLTNRRTTDRRRVPGLAGHRNAVTQFLPAVRDGNCDAYFKYAVTPPNETKAQSCRAAFGRDGLYTAVQADLRANPNPQVTPLGGNRLFAFFGIQTGAVYRTAATFRTPPAADEPYLVISTERAP